MKARVKATGEVKEVELKHFSDFVVYVDENGVMYKGLYDLDFGIEENHKGSQIIPLPYEPDYWDKLKHQAAIAAMQGLISNNTLLTALCNGNKDSLINEIVADNANLLATALVDKLKNEK